MRKEAIVSHERPADLVCRSDIMPNFYIEWSTQKKALILRLIYNLFYYITNNNTIQWIV